MPKLTKDQIIGAAYATLEVDESGDVNFRNYLAYLGEQGIVDPDMSLGGFLMGFLTWANGEDWLTSDKEDNVRIRQIAEII